MGGKACAIFNKQVLECGHSSFLFLGTFSLRYTTIDFFLFFVVISKRNQYYFSVFDFIN